jgi:hypothetical protein
MISFPQNKGDGKKIPSYLLPPFIFFQMLSIYVVLVLVLLVLTKADNKSINYIRGEKVNPAYRIVTANNHADPKNEILEFQTVKRHPGSKPAQEGAGIKRPAWF